jgi:hypothetical protein
MEQGAVVLESLCSSFRRLKRHGKDTAQFSD